jgi:thiamine-phosphate pyrophosphorylase
MLYFITPTVGKKIKADALPNLVADAIEGGAGIVQWRQKPSKEDLEIDEQLLNPFLIEVAKEIRKITREKNALFIVNDSMDLALELDADGVHIGQGDDTLTKVHEKLNAQNLKNFIIGVTVRDPQQVRIACEGGAAYVGAGPVFRSSTKPQANDGNLIGIEGLKDVVRSAEQYDVPVYAIGGIESDESQIEQCISEAGATGVAVVAAISSAKNPKFAARDFLQKLINASV